MKSGHMKSMWHGRCRARGSRKRAERPVGPLKRRQHMDWTDVSRVMTGSMPSMSPGAHAETVHFTAWELGGARKESCWPGNSDDREIGRPVRVLWMLTTVGGRLCGGIADDGDWREPPTVALRGRLWRFMAVPRRLVSFRSTYVREYLSLVWLGAGMESGEPLVCTRAHPTAVCFLCPSAH